MSKIECFQGDASGFINNDDDFAEIIQGVNIWGIVDLNSNQDNHQQEGDDPIDFGGVQDSPSEKTEEPSQVFNPTSDEQG